jgi:magnesium chelatase family protein
MNPCPCGYLNDPVKACTCSSGTVTKYQKRLSGPLLDRIDIHVEVPRVDYEKLSDRRTSETSDTISARVEAARQLQLQRFKETHETGSGCLSISCNADMRPAEIRQFCTLDSSGQSLMRTAMSQLQLTARAYHRVLKLARTIADLSGAAAISPANLAEALQYRPRMLAIP